MTRWGAMVWVGLCGAWGLCATGCSFNDGANSAFGCEGCAPEMCKLGFCLQAAREVEGVQGAAGTTVGTAGSSTEVTAGTEGGGSGTGVINGPCTEGDACFAGAAAARNQGACRDGSLRCSSDTTATCMGQILPADETCNAVDDDCDGKTDEALTLGMCPASGTGACASGVLQCENGVATCQASTEPSAETCNGVDDDCDGEVDNDLDERCYPQGVEGCEQQTDGSFTCAGLCAAGTRSCVDGQLTQCTGFVRPVPEVCGADEAADEDCNGVVDDGCPCSGDETQRCYTGPAGTAGVGTCVAGTQHCENGAFGACLGAITPVEESCGNPNADNDCNRFTDDIPRLGGFCMVAANLGDCRYGSRRCQGDSLVCVTPQAMPTETRCDNQDEDCDGDVDEVFDLANDENNCGQCGADCDGGDSCCGGACRDTDNDPNHCGGCGIRCGDGRACCNGTCEDLGTPDHCSSCSPCGANQDCCGGQCLDRGTAQNCSACNACDGSQDCCEGQCLDRGTADNCSACNACDGSSQDCCDGQCLDRGTVENCSACNACDGTSQDCCSGQCLDRGTAENCSACNACDGDSQDCCSGQCLDRGSAENCSACNACDGTSQDCCNGACLDRGTPENCSSCISCLGPTQSCCHETCVDLGTNDNCAGCDDACTSGCSCSGIECQDSSGAACQ